MKILVLLAFLVGCQYNHAIEVSAKTCCAEINVRYSLYHEPTQTPLGLCSANKETGFAGDRP